RHVVIRYARREIAAAHKPTGAHRGDARLVLTPRSAGENRDTTAVSVTSTRVDPGRGGSNGTHVDARGAIARGSFNVAVVCDDVGPCTPPGHGRWRGGTYPRPGGRRRGRPP